MNTKTYSGITVNDLYDALHKKVNHLVDEILSYKSDTFSSEASGITAQEAENIALALVLDNMQKMIDLETLDGSIISQELDNIRQ